MVAMSRVQQERQRRGWSLTRFTVETAINSSSLSLIERGKIPVYPAWQRQIARAFDLSPEELFDGRSVRPAC